MNYEIYKIVRNKETFLAEFCPFDVVDDIIRNRAYEKYVLRCEVLNRDGFKCQNVNCKTPDSNLTVHHIKHKRNLKKSRWYNGIDKARNLITICECCHNAFNAAKIALTFSNLDNVPAHVRGMSFKLDKPEPKINWKKVRAEMKVVRRNLKHSGITYKEAEWKRIIELMRWLSIPYAEEYACLA